MLKSDLLKDLKLVFIPIIAISITGIALGATPSIIGVLFEARSWSPTLIGLNGAIGSYAILLIPFTIVTLVRYASPKWLLVLSSISVALSLLIIFYISQTWVAFAARFVFSFGATALFLISEYWITAAVEPEKRGTILGIYGTSLAIGVSSGPFLALILSPTDAPIYWVLTAIILCATLPYFFTKQTIPCPSQVNLNRKTLYSIITLGKLAICSAIVFAALEYSIHSLLPVYGLENNLSEQASIWLISAFAIGMICLQFPIGLLADKYSKQLIIAALAFITATVVLALPLTINSPIGRSLCLLWIGGATGGLFVTSLALLSQYFNKDDLINANATFVTCYGVGSLLGPALLGIAIDISPLWGMPLGLSFCLTILGIYALKIYLQKNI